MIYSEVPNQPFKRFFLPTHLLDTLVFFVRREMLTANFPWQVILIDIVLMIFWRACFWVLHCIGVLEKQVLGLKTASENEQSRGPLSPVAYLIPSSSVLIPYACHYNPQFVYFLPTFWSSFMYCYLWPYVWLAFKSGNNQEGVIMAHVW